MKSVGVKSSTYIDFNKQISKDHPKFKVTNHVKISKYKNTLAKGYVSNWSEEAFMIKKDDNTVLWTYMLLVMLKKLIILCCGHMLLVMLMVRKLLERFIKTNIKKQIKQSLELKK